MQTPPGAASPFQPRRDVHPVAVDLLSLDPDIPQMNPDPKLHPAIRRQIRIPALEHPLNLDPTPHRLERRRKLREKVIPPKINHPPPMLLHQQLDLLPIVGKRPDRCLLILGHQPAVPDDIGGQDRGQSVFGGLGAQRQVLPPGNRIRT